MRRAGDSMHGLRTRAVVVLLCELGSASARRSPSPRVTSTARVARSFVRHGKGGKRREVGMDPWGWEQLAPWRDRRLELPVGAVLCIITGPTGGRPWSGAAARNTLPYLAADAGVCLTSCGMRHAVEMAREGVPLNIIQRQLGHANLRITSVYLQGIDNAPSVIDRTVP